MSGLLAVSGDEHALPQLVRSSDPSGCGTIPAHLNNSRHQPTVVERNALVSRNAWHDVVEQTQLVLEESPDYCFVCAALVPAAAPDALLQAYLDEAHRGRLAVVCGRRACRLA